MQETPIWQEANDMINLWHSEKSPGQNIYTTACEFLLLLPVPDACPALFTWKCCSIEFTSRCTCYVPWGRG